MYRVVIADDDKIIRTNIAQFIDNMDEYCVVAQFDNGKNVIDYIKENPVDVVLTDIKMRQVTGLDVAEYVYNNSLDIKVVLLSGYRNFEFAQQAVEFGVNSYLTKPVMPSEIRRIFNKIKESLDKKKPDKAHDDVKVQFDSDENKIMQKAIDYIKSNCFENISLGDVANYVYLSENYFGKLFKATLKMGFTDYIISLRIEEALRLLKLNKYTIKEISERVGYSDCSYFIRVFKSVTGFTPKRYCQNQNITPPKEN